MRRALAEQAAASTAAVSIALLTRRRCGLTFVHPDQPWPTAGPGGESDLAERDFRAAIDGAASMGAKGYDLRAATGLARLLSIRGAKEDASTLLRPRLDAAITGFDTIDIAAARSLASDLTS